MPGKRAVPAPPRGVRLLVLCASCAALDALVALSPLCALWFSPALLDAALYLILRVFMLLAALVLSALFGRHGLHPLFLCLMPGVCYMALTPLMGMRPMAGLTIALVLLSLIGACAGQEYRRRGGFRRGRSART